MSIALAPALNTLARRHCNEPGLVTDPPVEVVCSTPLANSGSATAKGKK